ncbi:MBL fold metallo-hydrolase [Paenibacillus sp. GCM10012307]|uniref:MBL fold metallo-hydrolase n=1 Tax=Paenibacillus roseus TaxID=2798579 RepID=A0A934MJW6_9BACL|nr:MBL fold metallo-hydrolase [Paenibacillus roseus]MBJ6360370.1 MBL fold metallo-hydrolase [Paenibacillus roseus]
MHTYQVEAIRVCYQHYINYSYLIIDRTTRMAAVVDPAWELNAILEALTRHEAILTTILLTHSHKDHVNLVGPLYNLYQPRVYMMRKEIDYYQYTCPSLYGLEDMDRVHIGETTVTSLLTPGHTAGGGCYLLSDSLFSGDTLFIEGCGMCSSKGSDPVELFHSVKRIRSLVHPDVKVYPGHSYGELPGQPMSYLHENNAYFQIESLENFIFFRMRKNQRDLLRFR